MFRLTAEEFDSLRSQFATLKTGRGQHRKYLPYAFTEHGAILAAMVLASPRAVQVSVYVVRAFVRLREAALQHKDLAKRPESLGEKTWRCSTMPSAAIRAPSCARCSRRRANSPCRPSRQEADRFGAARGEEEQAGRQGGRKARGSQV